MHQIKPDHDSPKKVLHINDAVFVLPDENKVCEEKLPKSKIDPNRLFTPLGILTISPNNLRCCMEAKLYELKDGYYVEMDEEDFSDE